MSRRIWQLHLSESSTAAAVVVKPTASARLNDCLHPGPALIGDLSTILTRFRLQRVAVTADIEKAFLQITLAPEHRDAARFFWLRNINQPDGPMDTYRFKSLLFGATSSPFVLHATI